MSDKQPTGSNKRPSARDPTGPSKKRKPTPPPQSNPATLDAIVTNLCRGILARKQSAYMEISPNDMAELRKVITEEGDFVGNLLRLIDSLATQLGTDATKKLTATPVYTYLEALYDFMISYDKVKASLRKQQVCIFTPTPKPWMGGVFCTKPYKNTFAHNLCEWCYCTQLNLIDYCTSKQLCVFNAKLGLK